MSKYPVEMKPGLRSFLDMTQKVPQDRPKVSAFPTMVDYLQLSHDELLKVILTDWPDRGWTIDDVKSVMDFKKQPPVEWFESIRKFHVQYEEDFLRPVYKIKEKERKREYCYDWTFKTDVVTDCPFIWGLFHLPLDALVFFRFP